MIENEYSKKVDNLNDYIEYCERNGFILDSKINQIRVLYRHSNKTLARITINNINNSLKKYLDFKEDKLTSDELISRKESKMIEFTDDEAVYSILDFLGYKKDNTLERVRYVYKKEDIVFELDEYIKPNKSCVVSLEGEKDKISKIWEELFKY